jgi:hypothetical protein
MWVLGINKSDFSSVLSLLNFDSFLSTWRPIQWLDDAVMFCFSIPCYILWTKEKYTENENNMSLSYFTLRTLLLDYCCHSFPLIASLTFHLFSLFFIWIHTFLPTFLFWFHSYILIKGLVSFLFFILKILALSIGRILDLWKKKNPFFIYHLLCMYMVFSKLVIFWFSSSFIGGWYVWWICGINVIGRFDGGIIGELSHDLQLFWCLEFV